MLLKMLSVPDNQNLEGKLVKTTKASFEVALLDIRLHCEAETTRWKLTRETSGPGFGSRKETMLNGNTHLLIQAVLSEQLSRSQGHSRCARGGVAARAAVGLELCWGLRQSGV